MRGPYIALGLLEIAVGILIVRHREALTSRLHRSRRPFPAKEEMDALVVTLAGPFSALIGLVTLLLGLT